MIFSGHKDSDILEKIFFAKDKFGIENIYIFDDEIKECSAMSNRSLVKRLSMVE